MLRIQFSVAGDHQYVRAFKAYGDELADMRPVLERVAERLKHAVGDQFQTEGAHGGLPWARLNDEYRRWKEVAFPGRPILVRSGALRAAYLVDGTRELTQQRLVWGVTDQVDDDGHRIADRASAHQTGKGRLPQRKIIDLTNADRRLLDREFVEWLNGLRHRMFAV